MQRGEAVHRGLQAGQPPVKHRSARRDSALPRIDRLCSRLADALAHASASDNIQMI
jgi:hypothetical protein